MPLNNMMKRGLKLAYAGQIRKGMKVPVMDGDKPKRDSKGIVMRPKEMPWFVFRCSEDTTAGEGKENEIEQNIYRLYGTNQIKALNIYLVNPDANANFSHWLEAYNYNTLIAKSDETYITYLYDVESQQTLIKDGVIIRHSSKPNSAAGKLVAKFPVGAQVPYGDDLTLGEAKESGNAIKFKASGRLDVILEGFYRLAKFTLFTSGYWEDIPQIYSTLQIVDAIVKSTGRAANTIPLILRRVERERTYTDQNGAKKKKVSYDVNLEIRPDFIQKVLADYHGSPFALSLSESISAPPALPNNHQIQVIEDEEDYESHDGDAEAQELKMNYEDALVVEVKNTRGNAVQMQELTPSQLTRIINSDKATQQQKDAAETILKVIGEQE